MVQAVDAAVLGLEARVNGSDHQALRLWLRMLSCSNQIQAELRRELRTQFNMSLGRFDYLAQLHRRPDGMSMKELSQALMVTGANITKLTVELQMDGLVTRQVEAADRRSYRLRLTPSGRSVFERIAVHHESWVVSLFSGLEQADMQLLSDLSGKLRQHVKQVSSEATRAL